MAIKNIYVHRDDILKIHIVDNKQIPATKTSYENQNRDLKMILIIRDSTTVGHLEYGLHFPLERFDGSVIRYKQ